MNINPLGVLFLLSIVILDLFAIFLLADSFRGRFPGFILWPAKVFVLAASFAALQIDVYLFFGWWEASRAWFEALHFAPNQLFPGVWLSGLSIPLTKAYVAISAGTAVMGIWVVFATISVRVRKTLVGF